MNKKIIDIWKFYIGRYHIIDVMEISCEMSYKMLYFDLVFEFCMDGRVRK